MAGKGSKQRPTDIKKFGDNYDAIFGKKNPVKKNMAYETYPYSF